MTKLKGVDFLLVVLGLLIIIASYIRIYFGIDVTDESYYIALPYRFILGDTPFIDEHAVHQLAALLILPFYKFFYFFTKDTSGIALYSRHLYFTAYFLLGCLSFKTFKKELGPSIALLISCFCVLYVPFNIMGLSYNSIAVLCLTAASLFTILDAQEKERANYYLPLAGLFYSLAIFSYPSMIMPTLVATIIICLRRGVVRSAVKLLLGCAPVVLISLILFAKYKLNVLNIYYYLHHIGYLSSEKQTIHTYFKFWQASILYPKITVFFVSGMLLVPGLTLLKQLTTPMAKSLYLVGYTCAVLFPLVMIFLHSAKYFTYHHPFIWYCVLINISLVAPIYFLFAYKNAFAKNLFFYLWLPSLFAGISTSLSSGNGFIGSVIGLYSAFLAMIAIAYIGIKTAGQEFDLSLQKKTNLIPTLLVLIILSLLIIYKFSFTYRDDSFFKLDTRMTSGPYKYLYTTYSKSEFLYRFQNDINYIAEHYPAKNIIVYPASSGFYLFTKLKPRTNTLWLIPNIDNKFAMELIEHSGKPDVSLIFNSLATDKQNQLLKTISSDDYLNYIDRQVYTIYVQKKIME